MKKFITIVAAGVLTALSLSARASQDDVSCNASAGGPRLSAEAILAKVTEMGYSVRKLEHEHGCYEVYATDKNGARVKLKMHPVTGQIVGSDHRS